MQMAEEWNGSVCSLSIDQPCALYGNIEKVCEERPTPLPWPDWNVICANVLIHSVNSSHVPIVLVNHEGCVMSMDFFQPVTISSSSPMVQCHVSSIPSWPHCCHSIAWSWFQLSNPADCHMLHILFIFSTDVTGHLSVWLTRTVPVDWRSFLPNLRSRFMPIKRLSVATCNESVVAWSNLTFDLRDEPAG